MQVSPEHLQQLAQLLSDTVSPDTPTRKAAENNLNSAAQQQGFLLLLLETVRSDQASKVVRQAAGVYFKNVVKRQWEEPEEVSFVSTLRRAAESQAYATGRAGHRARQECDQGEPCADHDQLG